MIDLAEVTATEVPIRFDPADCIVRLGMILLATDLTTERDAARLIPTDRAGVHVTRVTFQNPTTPENLRLMGPLLTEAAQLILPDEPLAAIYYSCTAASVVIGDAAITQAIQAARPGVPVITPTGAALAAFRTLGTRRVAVVTPYLRRTTEPMVRYFSEQGLDVVSAQCMGVEDDRDMARISAQTIFGAAIAADRPEAEAVFLSCTALPALGVIDAIETRLGKPVISSNQAALWQMLAHAGLSPAAQAVGRIFSVTSPEGGA
jgi:maleate isomerase